MSTQNLDVRRTGGSGLAAAVAGAFLLAALLTPAPADAQTTPAWLTVTGVAADGSETDLSGTDYRWLIEQDKTYHVQTLGRVCAGTGTACASDSDCVGIGTEICLAAGGADPTTFDPNWDQGNDSIPGGETLSVGFHQSYMPVVAKGCAGSDPGWQAAAACNELPIPVLDPETHYYVSVVPRSGYSIGGAGFKTDELGNVPATTVFVNQHEIPTAQISVFIFHDNAPINNAPDLPTEEPGLGPDQTDMSGFTLIVEDAGGRWGASAGVMSQDIFGNPLGTTYDAGGNVIGYEPLITGPDGRLTIKNLAPGKYGVTAVPPAGGDWIQTSTIEGTKIIDAWVKANEPPFFAEFGPAGFHVFIGYVQPFDIIPGGGGATLTGTVVNAHLSRPPDYAFYNGSCFGHTTPWVGLNDVSAVPGVGLYAAATDENCNFTIPNVPDGIYQLAVWDSALDLVMGFYGVTITTTETSPGVFETTCSTPNGSCDMGDVPVRQWFHRSEHRVFDDGNENGMWDDHEHPSAIETGFVMRWRDGAVYQENVSDGVGAFAFDQVFPFFSWLVAEVGFTRNKATGVTVVADNGGAIPGSVYGPAPYDDNDITFGRAIAPQDQTNPADPDCGGILGDNTFPCNEGADYRVDHGPVLTYGTQGFLGTTNAFLWGKRHYPDGENGGISGMVFYAVSRAENDPEMAGAEPWEPGIPGVTVNLYESGGVDPVTGVATKGAWLATTETDSWDASIPTGCKYGDSPENAPFMFDPDGDVPGSIPPLQQDCYDGLRVFNQARPAVFDGGYAFDQICLDLDGLENGCDSWSTPGMMPVDDYIVEVIAPPGYEDLKPEDKNVDFGDAYFPAPELLPPPCVGALHTVPAVLTLFPDEAIPAPFAGDEVPLCDSKLVTLSAGANAAADFFLFTEVPVASRGFGFILDDTQNEFDPNSPNFGEKYAPPFVPVTVRDWTGRIINKTISDQYGRYNFLAPSTITENLPQPSGISPNMLTTCMNDPGDDPDLPDPNWNQQYSTFCYTFQYMPGTTTYLDTPVVPVAAFTGPDQFPLDCEYGDGTPRIDQASVGTNGVGGGPYIPTYEVTSGPQGGRGVFVQGAHTITIHSMGSVPVQNPVYCNPAAGECPGDSDTIHKFVTRDYGFGATAGSVTIGDLDPAYYSCTWGEPITCTIAADTPVGPVGSMGGRQLTVTRGDNLRSTIAGVTVQVGLREDATVVTVSQPGTLLQTPITDAIDSLSTPDNALILVAPGIYNEMVVMSKPVQLQGWGEGSTTINAVKAPPEKLSIWRDYVDGLITDGKVDLLPGQEQAPGDPEPVTLWTEEGAGVLVLGAAGAFEEPENQGARIDGFTIKGADTGGGIIANGFNGYLEISNNRLSNNQGHYGGGIRVGHPILTVDGLYYTDGENDHVAIHNNQVVFNGSLDGAGAGISMCTGSDSYAITKNWVCGNFATTHGGGIGHFGMSRRVPGQGNTPAGPLPLIADNAVIFNESFVNAPTVSGGGIYIGGAPPLTPGGLSPGAGDVQVLRNLIQGNSAGAGDGGGIRLAAVNGEDVEANPDNDPPNNSNQPPQWGSVDIFNNMIVDNVAGLAGGGISLQDAVAVKIQNNTIANNDSVATAGDAFAPNSPNQSSPQPGAGVVSRIHSDALADLALPQNGGADIGTFSDPFEFSYNIIWQNRQFFFWVDPDSGCTPGDPNCTSTYGLCPDLTGGLECPGVPPGNNDPVYNEDLGVIGTAGSLPEAGNLLTPDGWTGPADPSGLFVSEYFNGARGAVTQTEITTGIQAPAAFDEGGNFIRPAHGPLSLYRDAAPGNGDPGVLFGDYHILSPSLAADAATGGVSPDYDGDTRPIGLTYDHGADEAGGGNRMPVAGDSATGGAATTAVTE